MFIQSYIGFQPDALISYIGKGKYWNEKDLVQMSDIIVPLIAMSLVNYVASSISF